MENYQKSALKATGNDTNFTDTEIRKLKFTSLSGDVASI